MKRLIPYLILIFLSGCTKSIILKKSLFGREAVAMYGSVPERNFYINKNLSDSLIFIGELKTKGSYSNTAPVIYDNALFVPDLSGRITAFDADGLKMIGTENYKGETPVAPALYRSRMFFAVNEYRENYAMFYYYDYFLNQYICKIEIPGAVHNEMLFDGSFCYLLNDMGTLYEFDLIGQKRWEFETNTLTRCDPAMSGELIVWGNQKGELLILNRKTKRVIHKKKLSSGFESGCVINDGNVFIGDNEGNLFSVELSSAQINWEYSSGYKITAAPAIDEGDVFIGNLNGDIFCVNKKSGAEKWKVNYGGVNNTTPLLFDNVMIQPNLNKRILFIEPESGKIKNVIKLERRPKMNPVYFKNRIYFGVDKGRILVYEED